MSKIRRRRFSPKDARNVCVAYLSHLRHPRPILENRKAYKMFLERREKAGKRALPDSESEIQKTKLCELSEPTSSMPQPSMPKQSLHKAFKKEKKKKKVVMKPRALIRPPLIPLSHVFLVCNLNSQCFMN